MNPLAGKHFRIPFKYASVYWTSRDG